ncbi:MAG: HAMP domain-containing protein [bacterium]
MFSRLRDVSIKTKIIVPLIVLILIPIILISYISFNIQKQLTISLTKHDAEVTAKTALSTLNTMMLTKTIQHTSYRRTLIKIYKRIKGIKGFQVIRGNLVNEQFGSGLSEEKPDSNFDRAILSSGIPITKEIYNNDQPAYLMVGIPFVAKTDSRGINCLVCHTNAVSGNVLGGIKIIYSLKTLNAAQSYFIKYSIIIALISIILIIIILYLIIKSAIINPILKLSKAADNISKGNFNEEIPLTRNDEIGKLARSFSRMEISLKKAIEILKGKQ